MRRRVAGWVLFGCGIALITSQTIEAAFLSWSTAIVWVGMIMLCKGNGIIDERVTRSKLERVG